MASRKHIHEARTLGERIADKTASVLGSWAFIITQTAIICLWVIWNMLPFLPHFDAEPFILLNLLFSTQAAYAAPILQLSSNRQSAKDRQRDDLEASEVDMMVQQDKQLYTINQQQLEILRLLHAHLAPDALSPDPGPGVTRDPRARARDAKTGRFLKREQAA